MQNRCSVKNNMHPAQLFRRMHKRSEKMKCLSYGAIITTDKRKDDELFSIENACAGCLYQAGKLSTNDVLISVINNELSETEKRIIEMYWFRNMSVKHISAVSGISVTSIRRALNRAVKKIESFMKYIVLYNEMLDPEKELPETIEVCITVKNNGKELKAG